MERKQTPGQAAARSKHIPEGKVDSTEYDVIIVGGGVIGLGAAYHAAFVDKKKVLVLEQFEFFTQAGSSPGVTRMYREMHSQAELAKLAKTVKPLWKKLHEDAVRAGVIAKDQVLIKDTDMVWFGDPMVEIEGPEGQFTDTAKACGEAKVVCDLVDHKTLTTAYGFTNLPRRFMGYVGRDKDDGDLTGGAGVVNYPIVLTACLGLAKLGGAVLCEHEGLVSIDSSSGDGVRVTTTKGNTYQGAKLILTPGCWLNDCLDLLGVELKLKIWQMTSAYFKRTGPESAKSPMWISFSYDKSEQHPDGVGFYYGFPDDGLCHPGYVRVCANFASDIYDRADEASYVASEVDIKNTEAWVGRHMLDVDPKAEHVSTCLTTISSDSNFVLSNPPATVPGYKNIVVFTAGWAAKFVPLFGRILVDIAFKGESALLPEHLRSGKNGGFGIPDNYTDRSGLLVRMPMPKAKL